MKQQEKDKLRSLFEQIEVNEPSLGFEERLMLQIHQKALEKSKKENIRRKIYTCLSVAGGFAAMIMIPILIIYFAGWKPDYDIAAFDVKMPYIDPFIISIFGVVLSLLVADTFIRKRMWDKRHKDN